MLALLPASSVLIACLAALAADEPLQIVLREREPLTGELRPLAGAQAAFLEKGPSPQDSSRIDYWLTGVAGERIASLKPAFVESNAQGLCSFSSAYGHTRWDQANGYVCVDKPGFVMTLLDTTSCSFAAEIEIPRGQVARTQLLLPVDSKCNPTVTARVEFDPPNAGRRCAFGAYALELNVRSDSDGSRWFEFELSGFARQESRALLRVPGFDVIELGPELDSKRVLSPARSLELRVCDWESGEAIDGVRPVLRYGTFDPRGHFLPADRHKFDHYGARLQREASLVADCVSGRQLSSEWVLLPGEDAAQLTNLAHDDYLPMIYLSQGGAACPAPITLLGPDGGGGVCTLYLRSRH
jgi:hypothetical protein